MALKKSMTSENGVPISYHRVVMVKTDVNQQVTILLHSYINETGRDYEIAYMSNEIEGEPTFPYVEARYLSFSYDPDMTVAKAYKTIKSLAEFEGAEDV